MQSNSKALEKPYVQTPLNVLNHIPRIVTRRNWCGGAQPMHFERLEAERKAKLAAEQAARPQKWY